MLESCGVGGEFSKVQSGLGILRLLTNAMKIMGVKFVEE